jgi:multimeric flavodoxin WrbA
MSINSELKKRIEKEGWKLASTTGGEHLKRTLEMYKELDIETRVIELDKDTCVECTKCYADGNNTAYRVYTRQKE